MKVLRESSLQLSTTAHQINKLQIVIGVTILLFGALVYLIDRPPDQTYFVYNSNINISLYNIIPNLFGVIGSSLPSFVHIFSFILITAGLLGCHKRGYLIICLSWVFVDCAFEIGQKYSTLPLKIIPRWFEGVPYLENSKNFFIQGTFDSFDLVAIATGAVIAYFILLSTMERRET